MIPFVKRDFDLEIRDLPIEHRTTLWRAFHRYNHWPSIMDLVHKLRWRHQETQAKALVMKAIDRGEYKE